MNKPMMSPEEVAEAMDLSVSHSYAIIRRLNKELAAKGFLTRAGRIPRKYFYERVGLEPDSLDDQESDHQKEKEAT